MNSHQVRVIQFISRGLVLPRCGCTESKIFILLRICVVIVWLSALLAFLLAAAMSWITFECVYLSANRFPTTLENGIRTSIFVFRLPTPSEKGIQNSILVFHFLTTLKMEFELLFPFFVFRFRKKLKNEIWSSIFDFRFSFLRFCHFRILPEPEEWSSSCSSCR